MSRVVDHRVGLVRRAEGFRVSAGPRAGWARRIVAGVMVSVATLAAAEPSAMLALQVEFFQTEGGAIGAVEKVGQRALEVRQAVRLWPTRVGPMVEFAGHPGQGVWLGALDLRPPVSLALWLKRAGAPAAHPAGAPHPEYAQEQREGLGRILSPLTGSPRVAGGQSGVLRLGPEGVAVWHGPTKWSAVVSHPLPAEEWFHLVVTFGADLTATGYVNGRPRGTTRSDFNFGPGPVGLASAALDRGFGFPFAGFIGGVRLYRGVLSPREIDALAASRPDP